MLRSIETGGSRNWAWAFVLVLALVARSGPAVAFETTAPYAILLDFASGTVLYEKDADRQIPPASLAKLMTLSVVFEQLKTGKLKLEDEFFVSENAWRTGGAASGGSTMFLPLNSKVAVSDLIKGIAIQSGNDATIAIAEGIAGTVPAFAEMMNRQAETIGLKNSHFTNPHGLPDPDLHVTMRDLALLATHLIRDYPERYHLFSEEEFTFNGISQKSRNPLLGIGADGLKTGHTAEAGYGLVASAKVGERRVVFAMAGLKSVKERADQARNMMTYGLQGFEDIELVPAGSAVGEIAVSDGVVDMVALRTEGPVRVLAARGSANDYEKTVTTTGPAAAPFPQTRRLGWLRITRAGQLVREEPLFPQTSVEQAGLAKRFGTAFLGLFE